ncbi:MULTISPECIES: NAD(P)-dependent oxidoreductase [Micromonospora]|uniref:D-3-phosphoglycerate dehydrogenase n=1 Tax=Micromonospora yangpuensis TaxID=683228 RepID=A0A1C6V3H8_9ACTN|nr:NAD(P)-dependent oxidoreductase [Micromonospora yangpuensis]GGM14855.1 dehydrogenase [Micromonospora yangpuensis]SCL60788.1 D-3-phosphoglycerate dehydrogenase [Micromonospora yangpuensis]
MTPRILLTEPIAAAGLDLLRATGEVHVAHSTDPTDLAGLLATADALVVRSSPVTAAMLETARRLKVVGRHGAGLDGIDLAAAERLGIGVVSTPGANADSVAEFVILAALTLARQTPPAVASLARGAFPAGRSLPSAVVAAGLTGTMLSGRTLGLIGLGAIGRGVAARAQGLGMTVLGHDIATTVAPAGVRLVGLDELLGAADVVSLHVPQTAATTGLVDAAALARMRPDALLVNTARAGVVDCAAVLAALDAGRLRGYAVDVFDPEPPAPDDPLLHHRRVFATPHLAAMTHDALDAMARAVAQGVIDYLKAVEGNQQ